MARSPLIKNGALALSSTGDLVDALDIETQMTVTVGAYHCIYDPTINSLLIPYLSGIPVGGFNNNTIINIVTQAYKKLISLGIITDLTVSVLAKVLSTVTIKITAVDAEGNSINLSWTNVIN